MQGNTELTVGCLALITLVYVRIHVFPYSNFSIKVPQTSVKPHNYDSTPQLKGK